MHGVPRIPWDAEGIFDGISTYKLDSHGKIYEHSVDNMILRDPPMFANPALLANLNFQPAATPQLGLNFGQQQLPALGESFYVPESAAAEEAHAFVISQLGVAFSAAEPRLER